MLGDLQHSKNFLVGLNLTGLPLVDPVRPFFVEKNVMFKCDLLFSMINVHTLQLEQSQNAEPELVKYEING